ncbi:MAG: hypothetical protein HDR05_06105 [Lachnospiraceae bacterium]|nr:hypothetical protein [Lachnospiraceae bacterium]
MKISYNAAAMRASNALNASDSKVSKSLMRLSSGLKVTTSKDNPSGYAIGRRMNTQITGIGTATQSSNNGISIIETADGALTEVHEMLQRMNELAVKGETGTLTTGDRMTLEAEVKQLKAEITRIASDTQFNGQTLLDGTFDLRGYTNNHQVKADYYSDEVIPKKYMIQELVVAYDEKGNIDKDATIINLVSSGDNAFPPGVEISETTKNKITLKGPLDFEMTLEVEPPEELPGTVDVTGKKQVQIPSFQVVYIQANPVSEASLSDTAANFAASLTSAAYINAVPEDQRIPADAEITAIFHTEDIWMDKIIIENKSGFYLELDSPGTNVTLNQWVGGNTVEVPKESLIIDATGIGTMDIQTGANEGQQLAVRIPTISLNRMGLEDTKMTTIEECAEANKAIKGAILYVSDARSRLGAYQNRLEHTVNNLAVSNENMTASYSRIMDVDMAEEMTNYTTEQVISQAAVSMLAQANERPSQVLQLLQ